MQIMTQNNYKLTSAAPVENMTWPPVLLLYLSGEGLIKTNLTLCTALPRVLSIAHSRSAELMGCTVENRRADTRPEPPLIKVGRMEFASGI